MKEVTIWKFELYKLLPNNLICDDYKSSTFGVASLFFPDIVNQEIKNVGKSTRQLLIVVDKSFNQGWHIHYDLLKADFKI